VCTNEQADQHPTGEVWSSDLAVQFERSALYHLPPLGGGTWYAESLTSYLSRLAEAHLLSVRTLVREVFLSQKLRMKRANPTPHFWWMYGRMINGTSSWARWWAAKTARLTGHHDLLLHNLVRWGTVLSVKNLMRPTAAWCAECLTQQRHVHQPIHMLLLWAIAVVKICPRHGVTLSECCPACARTQHPLEPSTRLGYCAHCRSWLGDVPPSHTPPDDPEQRWIAEQVGDLVGYPLVPTLNTPRVSFTRTLTEFLRRHDGRFPTLAHAVHFPEFTLRKWVAEQTKPQLATLLQLCSRLNTTLLAVLSGAGTGSGAHEERPPRPW